MKIEQITAVFTAYEQAALANNGYLRGLNRLVGDGELYPSVMLIKRYHPKFNKIHIMEATADILAMSQFPNPLKITSEFLAKKRNSDYKTICRIDAGEPDVYISTELAIFIGQDRLQSIFDGKK